MGKQLFAQGIGQQIGDGAEENGVGGLTHGNSVSPLNLNNVFNNALSSGHFAALHGNDFRLPVPHSANALYHNACRRDLPFYGKEDDSNRSTVRILDRGVLIWASKRTDRTVAEALTDDEQTLAASLKVNWMFV